MSTISKVISNYPYFVAVVLFCIGIYTTLSQSNLVKKIIGTNITGNAIYLLLISSAYIRGGLAPIAPHDGVLPEGAFYVNPLPHALVLTGIVVGLSVTAFALSMVIRLHQYYGTIETDEILEIRSWE